VSDPYLIPGTDVLRNKFNILNADELERRINDVAIAEAAVLFYAGPPVKPTMAGWQSVHKAMFGAVFDWAGEFRTIHIRKVDDTGHQDGYFASYERIVLDGKKAIQHLDATLRRVASADLLSIADNLADVYSQLNHLHPFREGNGRSQKIFFSTVCKPHGIALDWHKIPSDQHNVAARQARRGDLSLMREHFRTMISKSQDPQLRLRRQGA
jgi:cell filamentation protein